MNQQTYRKHHSRYSIAFFLLALLMTGSGCSTLPTSKPIAPSVKLADIKLSRLGWKTQEFAFELDVYNPNSYDLPVRTLDFDVSIESEHVVSGSHTEGILLPANSTAQTTVNVETRMNRLLRQLLVLSASDRQSLDYTVTGFVKLDNWPVKIPFSVNKSLENPVKKP